MAAKLGVLMQDQRLIPKIIKSHFCQKWELRCFAFVRQSSRMARRMINIDDDTYRLVQPVPGSHRLWRFTSEHQVPTWTRQSAQSPPGVRYYFTTLFYLRQGGYVFARVCLSVFQQDNSKSYGRIF